MAEGPEERVEDIIGQVRWGEPGIGKLLARRPPGGAEQNVPKRQEIGKILVQMLRSHRMMDTVVLRRRKTKGHATRGHADVEMHPDVACEINHGRNTQDDGGRLEENPQERIDNDGLDPEFQPEMAEGRQGVDGFLAMMK